LRTDCLVWYEATMVEQRPHRWLAAAIPSAFAAMVLCLAHPVIASQHARNVAADASRSAIQPNQQLISFLQTPVGVATVALALGLGGLAWTVGTVRKLERLETTERVPMSRSARKRARKRPAIAGPPAVLSTTSRVLAGVVSSAALILPLTFSIVINEDVFALPKTVGLWAIGGIVGAALVVLLVAGARPSRPGLLEISAAAFITLTAIATLTSVDPAHSLVGERLQYQGLISAAMYVLVFAGAVVALTTIGRFRILALAVLASSTIAAAYAIAQWFEIDLIWDVLYKDRVFSTVGQANALATTVAAGAIMALGLLPVAGRARQVGIGGSVVLCVVGLVLTFSRGGYVAFLLGLGVAGLVLLPEMGRVVDRRRVGRALVAAAAAVLIIGLSAVAWRPAGDLVERVAARTASIVDAAEGSNRAHLDLWTVGLVIAMDHPLLGTGPDTYVIVFPEYRDDVLSEESAEKMARFRPESPHNVYLAIASGAGFPALIAFVLLVGLCVVLGLRAARRAAMPARFAFAALLGAITVHLITIVFMTAEPATFALLWILLGALAGLARGTPGSVLDKEAAPAR
jgi:O-antigen ligase